MPDGQKTFRYYHYNPKDPAYEGMTQDELQAHFSEKLREEQGESKPRDEQEDNRQEPEPLNVSEGEEKEEVPANEEENQDWKDDKEKFWKQHCAGYEQDCERDAEDTEGLTLNISKDDKSSVRFATLTRSTPALPAQTAKPPIIRFSSVWLKTPSATIRPLTFRARCRRSLPPS